MKEIVIRRLTLLNFKGIRNLTVDFDTDETNIYGANASGKTTIFDAFLWVLFGKDSHDRTSFNIKTLDADGKAIERIPHEVTACIEVDGEEITLKRCYQEKWKKTRGSSVETFSGHGVEYFYNEVPCSEKEYKAKIDEICNEQVFKLITNPLFFTSQKKDEQRKKLCELAGNISDQDIIAAYPDFEPLAEWLTGGKTVDELKKEIAAKKRKVKDGIDGIPARIDERKRDMPEEQDWEAIKSEISDIEQDMANIDAQIADRSKSYNEAAKHKQAVAKELSDTKSRITTREYALRDQLMAGFNEQSRQHETAVTKAQRLHNERSAKALALPRLKNELAALQAKREKLIEEWKGIKTLTFAEPDRDMFVCPTCKRPLEAEDVDAKIEEMRSAFNADKAARFERNKAVGIETKAAIEAKQAEIDALNDTLFKLDEQIAQIENSSAYKAKPTAPDIAPTLASDTELQTLRTKAAQLQEELNSETQAPDTSDLQERKKTLQAMANNAQIRLNTRNLIESNAKRIAELEAEYASSQATLAEYEGIEYMIQQFGKARIEQVESRINGMFSIVKFKMYETQINGGEIETCEATVDGVPFGDLNNAMKINAGLDIINAVCRAYGIVAPIFIDNRESVSSIVSVSSQIVNLVVDPNCAKLKID